MSCDELMEPSHPLDPFGQPGPFEPAALGIFNVYVVMGLGPIMANEHSPQCASS